MSATLDNGDVGGMGNAGGKVESNGRDAEARLDESRRELRELFAPSEDMDRRGSHFLGSHFPRSKLMRTLTGNHGLALLAMGAGGLLLAKPKLLRHVVRMVPLGAIVRTAALRFMSRRL